MEDVFNDQPQEEQLQGNPQEQQPASGSTVEPQPGQPGEGGAPTAPENEKHVPLAALEAERKGRQDWKEKAIRYEEELKALRAQGQPQQQPQQLDPIQLVQQQLVNERFNTSEMVARSKYADLDAVVEEFAQAAEKNPALRMALQQSANPYEYAYREGKRIQMLKEIGDDPAAYRAKVEAEIRAQIQPSTPSTPLPASLAGARSTATRSAPSFTGPTPLGSVFPN
ncbi:hypothetical protein [Variovorax sp. JS1663]|uniref:hypothetical protein n=1 Tax=Variovorax sp. JS1663 TaxID=1851577 RepID=UPI000B346355|nr:hypothetical protein [Variovorax sp. JS1663]OUM01664.1 hypothetical protein A8M77_15435 [Variovorax sp. JS1663]